jgi:hypothetical protein
LTRNIQPLFGVLLIGGLLAPGCDFQADTRELRRREAKSLKQEVDQSDEVSKALQALPLLTRLERRPILKELSNQLNSWGSSQPTDSGWTSPLGLDSLPAELQQSPLALGLGQMEFTDAGCEYLWQSLVLRDLSRWIVERPYRDAIFRPWLATQQSQLAPAEALALEQTLKLFDWTIRNVALEGDPKQVESLPVDPRSPSTDQGLGYRTLPWQTVLFGHGDAIERARAFTQLLFAQGIPACMLAIRESSEAVPPPRLWCVGVPIGNELYLFEPRFGLPLPAGDQAAVATLRQARSDPSILRRANLPGRFTYPLSTEDLELAVALLDVEPFALSLSMRRLEANLVGEYRMRLATDIAQVVSRFQAIDPRLPVDLWSMPWLAQIYNSMVREQIQDRTPFGLTYQFQNQAYLNDWEFHRARLAHFRGEFAETLDAPGALARYMNSRFDEATLDKLSFDPEAQAKLQLGRQPSESQEDFMNRVEQLKGSFRAAKIDSNAFLGMLQYDLANVDASIDWLDKRLVQVGGTERWRPHAYYLLGRCFEEKGDLPKAAEYYKGENLPQEAGNRIRLRLLERQPLAEPSLPN